MKGLVKKVEKPWGYELIFAHTDKYVGKILHINKGHKLSLQFHRLKEETIYLYSGKMNLIFEESNDKLVEIVLNAGESHHISPKKKHRMIAIEDCDVFEVSTPELDDVVRLEDSYGRIK